MIVSIAGMPGVGKSTLVENLVKFGYVHPNSIYPKVLLLPEEEASLKRLDLIASTTARTLLALDYQKIYLSAEARRAKSIHELKSQGNTVVLDRGIEDTLFATETLQFSSHHDAQQLIDQFYPSIQIAKSDFVILLKGSLPVIRSRLLTRAKNSGRTENREEYFALFYDSYIDWYLRNAMSIAIIDTDSLDSLAVMNAVIEVLQSSKIQIKQAPQLMIEPL